MRWGAHIRGAGQQILIKSRFFLLRCEVKRCPFETNFHNCSPYWCMVHWLFDILSSKLTMLVLSYFNKKRSKNVATREKRRKNFQLSSLGFTINTLYNLAAVRRRIHNTSCPLLRSFNMSLIHLLTWNKESDVDLKKSENFWKPWNILLFLLSWPHSHPVL